MKFTNLSSTAGAYNYVAGQTDLTYPPSYTSPTNYNYRTEYSIPAMNDSIWFSTAASAAQNVNAEIAYMVEFY